jgi:phage-related protein
MSVGGKRTKKEDKPLVWLHGEVKTPPLSEGARLEAGLLLRKLQKGESLSMPHSRLMSSIGGRCHELRIVNHGHSWRVVYRVDSDAIVIAEVFDKKTRRTSRAVIERCKERFRRYDEVTKGRTRQ